MSPKRRKQALDLADALEVSHAPLEEFSKQLLAIYMNEVGKPGARYEGAACDLQAAAHLVSDARGHLDAAIYRLRAALKVAPKEKP